ncbi:MAG: arginine--tRNA ligase, partial [Solirubrobacterales bacterium]
MDGKPLAQLDPVGSLREVVREVAEDLGNGGSVGPSPTLERPPKAEMGDYSTNAAMLLAPSVGVAPREIAERLREPLSARLGADAKRIEVAGPGFLNLHLADRWYREAVRSVLGAGAGFGAGARSSRRVAVEFVSANPTGPLTAAGGRHAAFGDSLARILDRAGDDVERHYYLNDTGGQIERFAESIAARMTGGEIPEDGYEGAYVGELAEQLRTEGVDPAELERLGVLGAEAMRRLIEETLKRFRVVYDRWYSE